MNQQEKFNGALRWLRKRNNPSADKEEKENLPSEPQKDKDEEKLPLEKGDLRAMIIAALFTILPACLLVLLVLCGLLWLVFLR